MKSRKRHGGRRANRGTQPVTGEAARRKRRTRDRKAWRQVRRLLHLWTDASPFDMSIREMASAAVVCFDSPGGPVSGVPHVGSIGVRHVSEKGAFVVGLDVKMSAALRSTCAPWATLTEDQKARQSARYAREIDAARAAGHTLTAERIEAERDEYVEHGE